MSKPSTMRAGRVQWTPIIAAASKAPKARSGSGLGIDYLPGAAIPARGAIFPEIPALDKAE
jgi:hypothetical protein